MVGMNKAAIVTLISAALAVAIGAAGCAGRGGSSTSGDPLPLTCGANFRTPNYVLAHDPSTGTQNRVLYWPQFPVRIHLSDGISATYNGITYDTDDLIIEAAYRWTTASDGGVNFTQVGSAAQAQITIDVEQLASEPGGGDTLGFTQVQYYVSSRQIVSAAITIYTWPNMTRAEFVDGLRRTTLHEFGHAIFLHGHSDDSDDIMFPSSPKNADGQLSQRDINSLITTYCNNFSGNQLVARGRPNEEPVTITIRNCQSR